MPMNFRDVIILFLYFVLDIFFLTTFKKLTPPPAILPLTPIPVLSRKKKPKEIGNNKCDRMEKGKLCTLLAEL